MNKTEIRSVYREKRKLLSPSQIIELSSGILKETKGIQNITGFSTYHLFKSIARQNEIQTSLLDNWLTSIEKTIVYPKMSGEFDLKHFIVGPKTEFRSNKWGIPEPILSKEAQISEIEVVFVPLLAFDEKGGRLGYGKGFYDRFLSECMPSTLKVGLSFFGPHDELLPQESTDIPLTHCITPNRVYYFDKETDKN